MSPRWKWRVLLSALTVILTGSSGEELELEVKGSVVRKPADGVAISTDVDSLECEIRSATDQVKPSDGFEWFYLDEEDEDDKEEAFATGATVTVSTLVNEERPWRHVRCKSGLEYADFLVKMTNETEVGDLDPKMAFRVKKFKNSYPIVEKEDLKITCEALNRTVVADFQKFKDELEVSWYKWAVEEDFSYNPKTEVGVAKTVNCSAESMAGTKWMQIQNEDQEQEPHIRLLHKNGLNFSQIKIEDAQYSDRRGYKCVVRNRTNPEECAESVFFVRVKNKYAALWPFLGIVAEVVVLCFIIFVCERKRAAKEEEEEEDEEYNGNAIGQGGASENSNVRRRN